MALLPELSLVSFRRRQRDLDCRRRSTHSSPFRLSTPADWEWMLITAYWPLSTGPSPLASSLNGLNTFNPGRRKSWSLPVTIVRSWRRAGGGGPDCGETHYAAAFRVEGLFVQVPRVGRSFPFPRDRPTLGWITQSLQDCRKASSVASACTGFGITSGQRGRNAGRRFVSAGQGIGRHQAHLFGHPQRDYHPI